MGGPDWRRWITWGMALVLHGSLLIALPEAAELGPEATTFAGVEVEVQLLRHAPTPRRRAQKEETREPDASRERPKRARTSRRARGRARAQPEARSAQAETEAKEPPLEASPTDEEPKVAGTTTPRAPGISPLDAARTLVELGPTECDAGVADAADASRTDGDPTGTDPSARLVAEAFKRDSSDDVPYALESTPEGGFSFRGDAFVATIRPDGSVRFRDTLQETSPLGLSAPKARAGQTTRARGAALGLRLDRIVRDYMRKKPRNQARKRTFMQHTEALREQLAEAFRQRMLERGADALRERLAAIWGAPGPSEDKRRAIFELWDGCADDAQGLLGKRIVEVFVREVLPRSSALGYSDAELEELNGARRSQEPFAPYESPLPG